MRPTPTSIGEMLPAGVSLCLDRYWMLATASLALPHDSFDEVLQWDFADLDAAYQRAVDHMIDVYCYPSGPGPGEVVVDVGAGIGLGTIVFSRAVGPSGRVLALEAHPRTCDKLLATVRANALGNTSVENIAILDRPGTCRISDRRETANNTIHVRADHESTVSALADSFDRAADRHGLHEIDFLKMNIEGAEALALGGMDRTLAGTRRLVVACHDFVADLTGDARFRTKATVRTALQARGFRLTERVDDSRAFVRDYIYAERA
jgi:FkbM family methyltransferase